MTNPESRALQPTPPEYDIPFYDEQLFNYLASEGALAERALPSRFNLVGIRPIIDWLYSTSQEAYRYPSEFRQSVIDDISSRPETDNPQILRLRQQEIDRYEIKAAGERHSSFYLDEVEVIRVSSIEHGEYDRTKSDVADLYAAGKIPLLSVHTHPNGSLPSPIDYYFMIADLLGNREPLLKGLMVLCPDDQILALATTDTAVIDHETAQQLIDAHKSLLEDEIDSRLGHLLALQAKAEIASASVFGKVMNDIRKLAEPYDAKINSGELTVEEAKAQLNEKHGVDKIGERYAKRAFHARFRAKYRSESEILRQANGFLLNFAAMIRVKLYHSTDRQNFRAFSL